MEQRTSRASRGGAAPMRTSRLALAALLGVLVLALAGSAAADRFVPVAREAPMRMHEGFARLQSLSDDGSTAKITVHPMQFLDEVNAWRREVGAPPLEWDEDVAKVSAEWAGMLEAEECALERPTAEWTAEKYAASGGVLEPLGVNLAFACCQSPAPQSGQEVVGMWASEKKDYAFGPAGDACTLKPEEPEPEPEPEHAAGRRLMSSRGAAAGKGKGKGWSKLTLQPVDGPPIDAAYLGKAQGAAGAAEAAAEAAGEEAAQEVPEEPQEHKQEETPEEESPEEVAKEDEKEEEEAQEAATEAPEEAQPEEESPEEVAKQDEKEEEAQEAKEKGPEEPSSWFDDVAKQAHPEGEEGEEGEEAKQPEDAAQEPVEQEEEHEEEAETPEEEEKELEKELDSPEEVKEEQQEEKDAQPEEEEPEVEEPKEDQEKEKEMKEEEEKEIEEEKEEKEKEEEEEKEKEEKEEEEKEKEEEEKEKEEEEKEEEEKEEEEKPESESAGAAGSKSATAAVNQYTQVVWAETTKMGCAVAECGDKGTVWVCSFWPRGNVAGELPFCRSNVPEGMPSCSGLGEEEAGGEADAEMACEKPEGHCGFEGECCSCEEGEHEEEHGEQEDRQGEEDEKEGEEMEKQGGLKGDEEEEEEGKEEEKEGEKEEEEAEEEEKAGKEEAKEEEQEKEEEEKEEEEAKAASSIEMEVKLEGVSLEEFEPVKFQAVVAEELQVPLFDVHVATPKEEGGRRRLLGAGLVVPVTVDCEEAKCGGLKSKLAGLACNGELASALGAALGKPALKTACPDDDAADDAAPADTPGARPQEAQDTPAAASQPPGAPASGAPGAAGAPPASGDDEEEEDSEEEEEGARVTFPDAFPNSVRHWLLIGMLMSLVGLIVTFVFTFLPNREMPMAHVLCFIICGVAMCSYYCMWAGVGVVFKTSDTTPRVIFYAKYVDWVLTAPLILVTLALIANAKAPVMVALVGNAILFVLAMLVGATLVAPYKYMWWVLGMAFYLVLCLLLFRLQRKSSSSTLRSLLILTFLSWTLYPFLWILGMEGTGALGLSQQVALTAMVDLIAKVVFSIIVVTAPLERGEEDEEERVMRTRFSTVM